MAICPMEPIFKWTGECQCIQNDCAWYDRQTGKCAVLIFAQAKAKGGE
jgi:hypothetical protein